ncbi:MAG: ribose 5-phosphate isomerase B [Bacteroidia bacterium]|nr:ribose 5-phosphate isomerase B [Bacteroidia bacterium]
MTTISIGCDHAGYEYKEKIKDFLQKKGYKIIDKGCFSNQSVDYPDYAHQVAKSVEEKESERGILICGSGNGVNITANKHLAIRSALCWKKEIAELSRLHNDANIIALPARFTSIEECKEMTEVFLTTLFEGGRHLNRVNKIGCV